MTNQETLARTRRILDIDDNAEEYAAARLNLDTADAAVAALLDEHVDTLTADPATRADVAQRLADADAVARAAAELTATLNAARIARWQPTRQTIL